MESLDFQWAVAALADLDGAQRAALLDHPELPWNWMDPAEQDQFAAWCL